VDKTIDAYNSITPADTQTVTQNLSQKASQRAVYTQSVSPGKKPEKGTDFLPLVKTNWDQSDGYWDIVNNTENTPDPRIVYKDGGLSHTTYSGHAWVIDDYHVGSETFTSGGKLFQRPVYLVHCNLGWGGWGNGWYADGLFDTRSRTTIDDTPLSVVPGVLRSTTTEGTDYIFKYRMRIIPFLKPNTS
jgi:hypothetical protein